MNGGINLVTEAYLKPMEHQIFFVRFVRTAQSRFVNVLLDGSHLAYFTSDAETEEQFGEECEAFAASEKYKTAYKEFFQ